MNICVSSAGRRIALLECFRHALRDLGLPGRVCAVDASWTAPALHLVEAAWRVPSCRSPEFLPAMLELCQREQVGLLIPTIDTELAVYAEHREAFRELGTTVAVSGPATVAIAEDKVKTHTWLVKHGFPTVRQAAVEEVLAYPERWPFPLIVKPRFGSAGKGVDRVYSLEALRAAWEVHPEVIVQEVAIGDEHTINVWVDQAGRCRCAVPHLRLEVRSGEVSKARTVKYLPMMHLAQQIAEALPEVYGVLNLQCFLSPAGEVQVIEINARFGGGYPLAYAAGADFPRWMLQDVLGWSSDAAFDDWQEDLTMLRYDEAVFATRVQLEEESRRVAQRS